MSRASIRHRLVTRLVIVLVAVAVLANAGLYVYVRGELIEQYDDALQTQARAVAAVWKASGTTSQFGRDMAETFLHLVFWSTERLGLASFAAAAPAAHSMSVPDDAIPLP